MHYSDPAVKQILLTMNEKESFIIEDLDDYHLVIKADEEYRVRKELETEVHLISRHSYDALCSDDSFDSSARKEYLQSRGVDSSRTTDIVS